MLRLKKYLKDFVTERSIDISAKICCFNGEYRDLDLKINEIQGKIDQNLSTEIQGLFIKLEEIQTSQEAILQDALYKQGVIDGIRIASIIRKFEKYL